MSTHTPAAGWLVGSLHDELRTEVSNWHDPSHDATAISALLGIKASSIRQLLIDPAAGFPRPESRGSAGRNLWSLGAIYAYILERRPQLRHRVPRLFTPSAELNPAVLLLAHLETVRSSSCEVPQRYVVHHWRPSDGGGPIGIAYPTLLGPGQQAISPRAAAIALFERLTPSVEAVALCNDAHFVPRFKETAIGQPTMWVVDASTCDAANPRRSAQKYAWRDVAHLLQVDLPWWPTALRDESLMLAWRPGDAVQAVRPARGPWGPQPLLGLIAPDTPSALRRTLNALADKVTGELARSAAIEAAECPEQPGLIHAAAAAEDDLNLADQIISDRDLAMLLHYPVQDLALADRALATCNVSPIIKDVKAITPAMAATAAAQEWCANLIPVGRDHSHELGYHLLRRLRTYMDNAPTTPVTTWYTHGYDPDTWAVRTQDGTVFTTVGKSPLPFVPNSSGPTRYHGTGELSGEHAAGTMGDG